MKSLRKIHYLFMLLILSPTALFASQSKGLNLMLTHHYLGFISLAIFFISYIVVISEEFIHIRKSKPMVVCAGILWIIVGVAANYTNQSVHLADALNHNLLEYTNLLLFLLVTMTYINSLTERGVFAILRAWLLSKGFSYRQLFWITGVIAFFLSPIADNLTTALILCAVLQAVGNNDKKFITLGCINIVIAANAGGAFTPFGDITTLMVWQKNILSFFQFFNIFIPSLVNFLIPAIVMSFSLSNKKLPLVNANEKFKYGAIATIILFALTICTAISFHNFLHLPAAMGMMLGLGYLQFLGYFIKRHDTKYKRQNPKTEFPIFNMFRSIELIEWDTLLFFYGIILSVGALAALGYLVLASDYFYHTLGSNLSAIHHATPANIIVGFASAIIDNIPIMFAVLTMHPTMSEGQWLLVTLTAGVGGSMLSIGSAAGVALMGQARGYYTFFSHLKWTWVIVIAYLASVFVHIELNHALFLIPT